MNTASSKNNPIFNNLCSGILNFPEVRFAGVINDLGRQVAGGYKTEVVPLVDEEQHRMCLEHALELVMTKDLDAPLGHVNSIITRRQKVIMITIPFESHTFLVSVDLESKPDNVIEKIMPLIHNLKNSDNTI